MSHSNRGNGASALGSTRRLATRSVRAICIISAVTTLLFPLTASAQSALRSVGVRARALISSSPNLARGESNPAFVGGGVAADDVQLTPKTYLIFWGAWTGSALAAGNDPVDAKDYLTNFVNGLGSATDNWSTIATNYCIGTPHSTKCAPNAKRIQFRAGTLAGAWLDNTSPQALNPSSDAIGQEAFRGIVHFGLAQSQSLRNDQFAVLTPYGIGLPLKFCGYHSDGLISNGLEFSYIYMPYQYDPKTLGAACGAHTVNKDSSGLLDPFGETLSHEIMETATDPTGKGWLTSKGNEIADICDEETAPGKGNRNIFFGKNRFAVQGIWNNNANNGAGGCVNSSPIYGTPSSPTKVSAVADGLNTCRVTFTKPHSSGTRPITGYTIATSPSTIVTSVTQPGSVLITGLTSGTSYTFTVRAINAVGASFPSAPSAPCLVE